MFAHFVVGVGRPVPFKQTVPAGVLSATQILTERIFVLQITNQGSHFPERVC